MKPELPLPSSQSARARIPVTDDPLRAYSAVQRFCLHRLARLMQLQQEQAPDLPAGSWKTRLLQKAIFSTYRDCLSAGIGPEARDLIGTRES